MRNTVTMTIASTTTPTREKSSTRSPAFRGPPMGTGGGGGATGRAAGGVSAGEGGGAEMIRVNSLGPANAGEAGGSGCAAGGKFAEAGGADGAPPTSRSK